MQAKLAMRFEEVLETRQSVHSFKEEKFQWSKDLPVYAAIHALGWTAFEPVQMLIAAV